MAERNPLGRVVILNGAPRAGKSSIATTIQNNFDGAWLNLGVDRYKAMIPERYQPGIGLRPGGERPDLEPLIETMYAALYVSIAVHSRLGLNVVADVGHHDFYSRPLGILPACARRLAGIPVLFVGVRCPIEVILERRLATWGAGREPDGSIPPGVQRFQDAVHTPGLYDLEVDTAELTPEACAERIAERLASPTPPTAFRRLAEM